MVSFWARQILSKTHKNKLSSSLKEALRLTLADGNQSLSTLNLQKSFATLLSNETINCTRGFHTTVSNQAKSLKCPPPRKNKVWPCGIEPKKIIKPPPSKCTSNYYDPGIVPLSCDEPGQYLMDNPNYKHQKPRKNPKCEKRRLPCCEEPDRYSCISEPTHMCGCHKPLAPIAAYSERLAIELPSLVRCKECGPHYSQSCRKNRSVKFNCANRPRKQRRCKNYIKPVVKEPKWSEMQKCKSLNICDDLRRRPKRADEYMPKRPIKCLQPVFPHLHKFTA